MIILAVIGPIFLYGMVTSTLGTILPELSKRFSLSPRQNGTIAFVQALGLILASLLGGPLLDSEGEKAGLILGLVLITIALSWLPHSQGYRGLLLLMFAIGMAGGVVITAANALESNISGTHKATALTLANLFFGLGGFVTPFLSANLLHRQWTRLCYLIAGVSTLTLLIVGISRIPAPAAAHQFPIMTAMRAVTNPSVLLLGFFLFLYVSCEVGVWNWLVQHLIAQGISEDTALNILSFGFALGLLGGRLIVSPILIRVPMTIVLIIASIFTTITTYLVLPARRTKVAVVMVALAGVAMAPVFPTTLAVIGDMFPTMAGTAIGFVITCGWIGLAVSSRVIGTISGNQPARLRKALLLLPVSAVVMSILAVILHSRLHGI